MFDDDKRDTCKAGAVEEKPPQWSLFERLLKMVGWTDLHIRKRRGRLALLRLTDEQLRDIGLSRRQIDAGYINAWIDRLNSSRHR